jgi:hypothetical protein
MASYSARSACMGSMEAALRAGSNPAIGTVNGILGRLIVARDLRQKRKEESGIGRLPCVLVLSIFDQAHNLAVPAVLSSPHAHVTRVTSALVASEVA